jgi:hypothetical protein
MLDKTTRKKLLKHNWLDYAQEHSNPSGALKRFRDQAQRAINDLALFAEKLPHGTQQEIFNYSNTNKLVNAILKGSPDGQDSSQDNARRTELAALLVRSGSYFCIEQYESKIETSSILNKGNINNLKNSINICDTIAFKTKLPEIRSVEQKEHLTLLFNWSKIEEIVHDTRTSELEGEDTKKFVAFYEKEFGTPGVPIEIIHHIRLEPFEQRSKTFEFSDASGIMGVTGAMDIDFERKRAELRVNEGNEVKLQRNLVVKMQNDGDLYVYMDRNDNYTKVD